MIDYFYGKKLVGVYTAYAQFTNAISGRHITSNIFHYDLYVKKKDSIILCVAIIGMVVNVGLNLILIPKYNIFGAAIATLLSFFMIFLLKFYFSTRK